MAGVPTLIVTKWARIPHCETAPASLSLTLSPDVVLREREITYREGPVPRTPEEPLIASDGLLARDNGPWGKEKLSFLEEYVPPALRATAEKRERHFVDLFAGPGKNKVRRTGEEFDGSALRIVRMIEHSRDGTPLRFTHATFVNLDPDDHAALTERLDRMHQALQSLIPRSQIQLTHGDANQQLPAILDRIHPRSYAFIFADIENPTQWPWKSVEILGATRRESTDFTVLFPYGMAIQRLLAWKGEALEMFSAALTRFYGTDEWRDHYKRRITNAHTAEMGRNLEGLYVRRLQQFWTHVRVVRDVRRVGEHRLYKLIFASHHDAADRIAGWSADRSDQFRFL